MPNLWLLKTEPSTYSFAELERDGKAVWDGVTSNAALKNIRAMKKGDLALIYHSGNEKAIIGLAEVASDPYPDPKQNDPKLVVFDLRPKKRLPKLVPLAEIKKQRSLANFDLVRISRLSIMPVTEKQWEVLMKMAGEKFNYSK
jgi:predicted RNA-binding protein with PUA-like domain